MKPLLTTMKSSGRSHKKLNHSLIQTGSVMQQGLRISKHISILYVEDIMIYQALVRRALENLGCKCEIANHGLEALNLLKHRSYDLILMDVDMPLLNGLQTTRHIRESLQLELPIIAVTTNTSAHDVRDCLNAGMNDHIGKPFTTGDLAQVIYKWNNRSYSLASF